MAADVQFLILSEGKSNILPADLILPFRPSSFVSVSMEDGEMLKAWRWYLATMKSLPHSIEPNLQKVGHKFNSCFPSEFCAYFKSRFCSSGN